MGRRFVLLILVATALVLFARIDWVSSAALQRDAKRALVRGEYARAEGLGRRLMARSGRASAGRLIVGEAASLQGRYEEALDHLREIPDDKSPLAVAGRFAAGEILSTRLFRLSEAIDAYRQALEIDPQHVPSHERLSYLLGVAGLAWDAQPHRMALLEHDRFEGVHLILLALGNTAAENPQAIRRFAESTADDALAQCGMARAEIRDNRMDAARMRLERALADRPEVCEAQAWLGSLLLQTATQAEYLAWEARLPAAADHHPEIWFVRGLRAQSQKDLPAAVRCFAEAVERDPNHQAANYQLGQTLIALGLPEQAGSFVTRARLLGDLIVAAKTWQISEGVSAAEHALQLTQKLGLSWEAWGWQRLSADRAHIALPPFPVESLANAAPREHSGAMDHWRSSRRPRDFSVAWYLDVAKYPLPIPSKPATDTSAVGGAPLVAQGAIQFRDDAGPAGIDLTFVNGSRPETAGEYMYEFSGGGVAVVDYDGDNWPDFYLTQGSDWPPDPRQRRHLDRLYRNLGDGRFADVTARAGIVEECFSQGAAVGDFDNDGFPDVYVGNIGENRLWHNNGDGTFTDVTRSAAVAGSRWTTSCLMADLNHDALPDLVAVNYVEGGELFERPCLLKDGSPRLCTPHEFPAAEDELYLNLGDGTFRDISAQAGFEVPDGKGLGVVAADFDGSGKISLFVANDAVPNFLFVNQASPGAFPAFGEFGFVSGLAVDANGLAQASMGVACGDANGDGRLDLFVTNFYRESNTLYVQQAGLTFVDATRTAHLHDPSYEMLGFGTQFLDADLDGLLDLVVTNGHVGNLEQHGVPYRMPTQVFRNVGGGRFVEIAAPRLGPFFERPHLGRGLARLDWNRDGREDFAVSHLEEPVALLTNTTPTAAHFLTVHLRGVQSGRDAIGTTVNIRCGKFNLTRQLTAGDGYQASNERQLVFGLGSHEQVDAIEIRWPSGQVQNLPGASADCTVLCIEGRSAWVALP